MGVRVLRTQRANGEFILRTFWRDVAPRMPKLPDSVQRASSQVRLEDLDCAFLNHARPHMSLGPGIPAASRPPAQESAHRHCIPAGHTV
jgi:hypothetical protein